MRDTLTDFMAETAHLTRFIAAVLFAGSGWLLGAIAGAFLGGLLFGTAGQLIFGITFAVIMIAAGAVVLARVIRSL